MSRELALLPGYLTGHLQLSLLAIFLGTAISVPLGVLATRMRWLEQPLLAVASAIQTIPGLALLAVLVPLLAALALPSIGFLPAILGLTLYGLLPILRNTVTGIRGIDPAVIEAARGVGMTDLQQLRRVELPLALPVIVAGIRTATVWTVGMATLSTPVGATSLGNFIFSGLQTRNFAAVLVGSISAALLALALDGLVLLLERGLRERRRGVLGAALAATIALYAYAGATLAGALRHDAQRPVAIGAKTFTEQYVLAELLARWIEREAGRPARIAPSLGSTVAFDALRAGEIDLYVDYSGTLWTTVLHREAPPPSRAAAIEEIRRVLREQDGIEVAAALGFENAYALAMREADAERLGVRTISDLAVVAGSRAIGGDYEFFARPEWRALETTYGLHFREQRTMDPSLLYQAVASGGVDAISAYSTDGRIEALHLRVLEDDRHAIPPYDALVLTRRALAQSEPGVAKALARLDGAIDAARMRQLNLLVDQQGESPGAAAERGLALLARGDRLPLTTPGGTAASGGTAAPIAPAGAKSATRP